MIYIGDIINFQQYVNTKEEEQKRIRRVSSLSNRCANIDGILHSISDSLGVSFVTKHFNELNQIVGKEHVIDKELYNVVVNAFSDYKKSIKDEIEKLNKCDKEVGK